MKGSECRLIEYMEGSKKRFIIPVYQRNYDWKTENCKQLYDDLVKVIKNNRRSHFFGSLVSVYEPSGRNTEFLVIDGQQRLTTVSLLFLAMYNLISNGITVPEDASLGKQIYEDFLVDKYQTQDTRIKLKPVKNDQKAFGKLFDSEDEHIRESNLTMNYNYFYDRIQKQEITIDQLFDAICSLEIINITLNNEDNPQLIFESLNSTGLDLSEGDKIRNFILMGLPAKEQDEYYEKYWNRIEECTKYDVSSFVRDYLSVKQLVIPSQKKIYISFKARFPDDDEFATQFTERQVYQMNSKNKIYILERLENYGTAEDKDVYSHCDDGTYSIEHIMPQHLTPAWVKALGDDYEQIHETWLHRIANLTLTAYNSKYSNSSFAEKKTMKNGFEDSGIRMNTYIAKKEKWTLTELEERNQYLMGRALEIWLTPSTEFKPEEKQLDSYTLDDDANLSGRLIARFSYKNTEQPVTSWVEMFQKVLQILYAEDKNVITKLAASKEDNIALHFSMNETDFTKSAEIGDGIYVWTNTSTQSKLSVLSRVFKLYDADPTDLVFYLRDENEGVEDEVGTRYELRRKYWTYALDYIKKTHGEGGSFSNVNPSKENWINGFFGISGFSLCCVANYDSARVELYFGKAKKEDNKKAFDAVILHKDAIENSLGVKLIWNRGDDIKSSKISYQINNVSIENETDWLQMAKFHAHWSKKFYDVIVPYLR